MSPTARDAAANRDRIETAARRMVDNGESLGLNAVARAAEVGVATVYRHFRSPDELEEALVWNRFDALSDLLHDAGPGQLERALSTHYALLVEDALFERVTARPTPALARTAELRDSLIARLDTVLSAARASGEVRADVGAGEVLVLLCGIAHSARVAGATVGDPFASILLRVVLDGLKGPAR
jgi:AcrR family transcriptional regulator